MGLLYSLFLYYLLLLCSNTADAVTKQWIPNTNFDNPKNWNVGRLPCNNDSISFTAQSPSVHIQNSLTIVSIQLPMNGEIILGDGSFIAAAAPSSPTGGSGNSGQGTCQGQDVKFNRTEPLPWLDPNNWHEGESGKQPPRLDTERVPCTYDNVIFPSQSTFLVSLHSQVKLKSLTISGKSYSTLSLTQFLGTTDGKNQFNFTKDADITITDKDCEDVTGCACGNDKGMIMHEICELQKPHCPKVLCDTPLTPKGHCCPVCGAVIILDYTSGFKFKALERKIKQNFIQQKTHFYVIFSKSSNDRIQLVVLDTEKTGENAIQMGKKIQKYIQDDINGPRKLALVDLSIQKSGAPHSPNTGARTSRPFFHSPGSIAGVVITGIIVLLVIALVMYCLVDRNQCRKRMTLSLGNPFRRFSTGSEKGGIEMDDSISYMDVMRATGELNTFDNPMYNTPTTSTPSVQDLAKHKQAEVMNNNDCPAILDPSSVTFVRTNDRNNMDGNTSFANPLFGGRSVNINIIDPNLRLNPMYSDEGVEEDSQI